MLIARMVSSKQICTISLSLRELGILVESIDLSRFPVTSGDFLEAIIMKHKLQNTINMQGN